VFCFGKFAVMNNCEQRHRLDAYHDGELSAPERAALERHIRDCTRCGAELEAMRRMTSILAAGTAAEALDEELLQLAEAVRAHPAAAAFGHLLRQTLVAALVVLAFGIAINIYLGRRTGAAAREAMVLDFATVPAQADVGSKSVGPVAGVIEDQQAQIARWIVDDLKASREVTR
jgi:anti-sigma factor RsiW